jgi:predicted transcriptional regulator
MSEDEQTDTEPEESTAPEEGVEIEVETDVEPEEGGARKRLEAEADKAVSEFDATVIDILSWVLDTETRGRIYVYLRKEPWSTSEEVAEGTGLYPSTVREALAELSEEGIVERRKRESAGAGNNPYEYTAIPPSELVANVVGRVQEELNTLFNMDAYLGESEERTEEPVRIEVTAGEEAEPGESETEEAEPEEPESEEAESPEAGIEEDETGEA